MKTALTPEQIKQNWEVYITYIDHYISSPRKEKLIDFFNQHQEELILMPASNKRSYHNAIPGGYIDHVNRVIEASLKLHTVWNNMGAYTDTYSIEELVFSALNHDLGKIGDGNNYAYLPSQDNWRKENLGEMYSFNSKIQYMSVPDRSLFLLHKIGVEISYNEWIAIKTHDGLYDQGNEAYLKSFMPETKPRTSLPYIIHQADLMAARIEFEREYLDDLNKGEPMIKKKNTNNFNQNPSSVKAKAIKQISANSPSNLTDIMSNFFD
jgi:hypothetical protein